MIIREANIEDLDKGLLDLFIEGYRFHELGRPDIFKASDEELKTNLLEDFRHLQFLVLIIDDSMVGYLAYEIKGKTKSKIYIDQLIISEKYRHKGYGELLMNKIIELGKLNNCTRIELDCWAFNENAIAMYEHIGFKKQRIVFEREI